MRRRGTAFVVALVMLFSTIPTGVFASEMTEFSDMPNDWSKEALERAVENGLLKGDNGKIRANDYLTRAEMATIVNRGFNAADKASLNRFTDVAGDDWFYEEMQKAVQMKTFEGSGNRLNPRNNITREEAFVVLARAFKLSDEFGYELNSFNDSDMISSWAKNEVAALVSEGYVAGSGGKINPKKNITRAEFAQIMHNLVKTYINKEGEYTEDYQGNVMINRRNAILKGSTISGDLIIGDGVGDGDVTLDDVTVTGRLIVRGGGEDSIIIKGDSDIRSITIVKVKGSVRVYSQDGANIGTVVVDGTDNVVLEGKFNNVTVLAKDTNVLAKNANIQSVTVDGDDSRLTIGSDSDVKTLNLNGAGTKTEISGKVGNIEVAKRAEGATVTVEKNGKVDSIAANSEGTKITGSGEVKDVKANANNIAVDTKDTKVSAAEGTKGVTAGGKTVESGKSETSDTSKSESSSSGSSSSGGGGGGGGGSSSDGGSPTPTEPDTRVVKVSAISVTGKDNVVIGETLQLGVTVGPENASNKKVTWSVTTLDGGKATITQNGLLTPSVVGTVTVKATAQDGSGVSKEFVVTITAKPLGVATLSHKDSGDGITTQIKVSINDSEKNEYEIYFDGKKLATATNGIVRIAKAVLKDMSRVEIHIGENVYTAVKGLSWE